MSEHKFKLYEVKKTYYLVAEDIDEVEIAIHNLMVEGSSSEQQFVPIGEPLDIDDIMEVDLSAISADDLQEVMEHMDGYEEYWS